MGNFSTVLAAIMCAVTPLASAEATELKTEQTQTSLKLGKETISSIRDSYQKGEYNEFLSETDASYSQALSDNGLDGLIQMRQKPIPAEFHEKWEQQFSDLQKLKNKELISAISEKDESLFAEKVRSVAANLSTPEQEKAIAKLNSLITKAPKTGANEDENTLIDIDLEYEYKMLNAQLPMSDISPQKSQVHQIALRMEKMDKMVEASKSFQDHSLKQAVGLAAANLDARLARNLDGTDLNALVKGKMKASNEVEEKVFSILTSYQGQFTDLMKEIGDANH